ncbi:MAG: hypothetical protein PHE84_12565 [bacterium]|nr:hypothetical protein [bacterium]
MKTFFDPQTAMVLDLVIGFGTPIAGFILYRANILPRREWCLLWLGIAIGLGFEIPFNLAGDDFLRVLVDWPLPRITVNICHSFWDGLLFLGGVALCRIILRSDRFLSNFSFSAWAIQTVWGVSQAFIIELLNNGVLWRYAVRPYNPAFITIGGEQYTILVQLIWLVIPTIYYLASLRLLRRCRKT